MSSRADIVETGSRWARAATVVIDAPASDVFDVLAADGTRARAAARVRTVAA